MWSYPHLYINGEAGISLWDFCGVGMAPAAHGEEHSAADVYTAVCGWLQTGAGDIPWKNGGLWRAHTGAGKRNAEEER